jgi:hypothetical protein
MQGDHFDLLDEYVRAYLPTQDRALQARFKRFEARCKGERAPNAVTDPDPYSH